MGSFQNSSEPIAIIGTGCRFPGGCDSPSKLWELLRAPRDLLKEIPESRFSVDSFYHPDNAHHGTSNVRHSYFLEEDLRQFDVQFFGIKPIEANAVDPQQRLLLETVYEGLESAGLSIQRLQGSDTAVYVGVMSADFTDLVGRDTETFPTYFATGTARSILSNRLSYFFDWHGPSLTIDTACSSSLIAMHHAVQTLRSGDSSLAIVAGSNLILGPEQYIAESKLQMLSPTGRSRMWDAAADGYARGEGVAAIVLKRLSQAIADGDHIECVIRETGVNQDGKTPGITMPSATAQAALIRSTYAKAGLDLSNRSDRPQYFEAHGTGTPAGDPIEARAIQTAFFGPDLNFTADSRKDTLFVGSIKTVVGHTEGTAGLAAVIKASLALQSGTIPPNRLLEQLNPAIKPFYNSLKILAAAEDWPQLSRGGVRRVSVNSFGFGGANSHAILESYEPSLHSHKGTRDISFSPFTFSAASETALVASLRAYRDLLSTRSDVRLTDLAWTLNSRRSTLASRVAIAASDKDDLVLKLDDRAENYDGSDTFMDAGHRKPNANELRILGVFTGQGAQWARMGAELIEQCPGASKVVDALEQSLRSLPPQDRPTWSLREQLLAPPSSSMVSTASISQPLCTAIQIMLVDMLREAGIQFSAVVGHSSGEIGAAYAAGCLSAKDAIRVAYYRGVHLKSALQKGSMLAVGTTFEDAQDLCNLPTFEDRLCVAASNSPSSVTISGDSDAIEEIKVVFDEEKKFTRLLKVDRAYHSHHMQDCVEPYVRSLRQCSVTFRPPNRNQCVWISSVFVQDIHQLSEDGSDRYWGSNLARPVMFAEALQLLLSLEGSFDLAVEVGPHPALKGPASQTIQDALGYSIPYTGVLSRGNSDVEAFAAALGSIWTAFGDGAVDFSRLQKFTSGSAAQPQLLKGLPTYQWDHNRVFWHESRVSKAFRTRKDVPNELLGRQVLDGAPNQLRWRNILRPREIAWLEGHQVQGQMVFPCAGYVSACAEASMRLAVGQNVESIELEEFVVGQAIVFNDSNSEVETLATLTEVVHRQQTISANFAFYSCPTGGESLELVRNASCRLRITVGDSAVDLLQPQAEADFALLEVESDRFYNALGQLGFGYTGPFRSLTALKRKLGIARGLIENAPPSFNHSQPLLIHPATLDAAIQSIMLAYCYPGDSMLRAIHLPTGIEKLTLNPVNCLKFAGQSVQVPFDSSASTGSGRSLQGDVSIYSLDGSRAVQLEGLQTQPLSSPTEASDLNIFTELVWGVDRPDCEEILRTTVVEDFDAELLFSLERVAYFYLRSLGEAVPERERNGLEWHHKRLFAYVDHVLSRVARGVNRFARPEWAADSKNDILKILQKYPDNIDLRLMRAVGENLPAVVRGQLTMLEPMIQDNMLNDFYVIAHGMPRYTKYLAAMASQISHRYPHMNVLEIGAGTGGATKSFLKELGEGFSTYTFTDISSGFFEKASQVFASYSAKMNFKVLDIEKDIESQGFAPESFDLIIASLVLHATRDLAQTVRNVRRLLKPGGYLLLLEITENEQMRFGLIFGGLPGWWLGYEDGRPFSPCVDIEEWSRVLEQNGFSGIETAIPHHDTLPAPLSVIVSQAVNEKVQFLHNPLDSIRGSTVIPRLTIIGGGGRRSAQLIDAVSSLVQPQCGQLRVVDSLQKICSEVLPVGGSVLSLTDFDEPVFKSMDADKLRGFQEIFKQSKNVLWVTQGSRSGDPYARMVVGFGRTIVLEMLHLRLQFLDVSPSSSPDASAIAEAMLRLEVSGSWEDEGAEDGAVLHSVEPELSISDGRCWVPRFKPNKEQNERYNSVRRSIETEQSFSDTCVELVYRDNSLSLLEVTHSSSEPLAEPSTKYLELDVNYSVSKAVEVVPGCYLFLILGRDTDTGDRFIALSPKQSSRVRIPRALVLPQHTSHGTINENSLDAFFHEIVARSILRDVPYGSAAIALQPNSLLADALREAAQDKGVTLHLWSTQASDLESEWTYIHRKASKTEVQNAIPRNVTCFFDMGGDESIATKILACLPDHTQAKKEASITAHEAHLIPTVLPDIRSLLMDIGRAMRTRGKSSSPDLRIVDLTDIVKGQADSETSIINWLESSSRVPVAVEPIEARVQFRSDRTYWLVGLTGGLGLSLCEWMAQQGARYIVLSSRSPKVDGRWLAKMNRMGVTVEVVANDISNRDSVQRVYNKIRTELPPISGVAQGAMVLHDTMFLDLDMERMNKVLRPKVDGSTYLEEIFHDTELEFFVFFSSMAAVTGNPGQSAYAAANMFMASLANQRRQRGLNASAVHIGAIFGNGYVTRELTLVQQEFLRKVGNLWLSEHDFRRLFAEAVYAGRHHRGRSPELSTGLKILESDESESITWFNNPVFQHCIKQSGRVDLISETSTSAAPVKVRLAEASSSADIYDIISDAFVTKLKTSLQVEGDRPIVDLTADTLGIDSLVAVDIRSWFIKELQVEIPVLKILSGATVGEMVTQAQELLPKELTPNLDPNAEAKPSKPKNTVQPKQQTKKTIQLQNVAKAPQPALSQQVSSGVQNMIKTNPPKEAEAKQPRPEVKQAAPKDSQYPTALETPSKLQDPSRNIVVAKDLAAEEKHLTDQEPVPSNMSSSSWSEIDESEGKVETSSSSSSTSASQIITKTKPVEVKKSVPMAFGQSRFWFLRHYLEDPSSFNITVSIQLDGPLKIDHFARAVQVVGQRHEALRTRFVTDEAQGTTKQEVLALSNLTLEERTISTDEEAEGVYQELKGYAFDLEKGENIRIILLKRSNRSFTLIIAYHHINMDGVSLEVLLRDLQMAYDSKFLSPRILQYADFSEQQRRDYQSGKWAEDLAFWKKEFQTMPGPLPLLSMARTSTRSPLTAYKTHSAEFHIDPATLDTIQSTCQRMKVTPFHFHLAVFYTMLIRLVDVENLCIGISSANRSQQDTLQSVGLYLNLLPLNFTPQLDQTFTNVLHIVREKSVQAFAHSKVPFDVIVNELGAARSATHSPLFQVLVNYRAGVSERRSFCNCDSKVLTFEQGQTPYDLSLDVIDNPGGDCHVIMAGQSVLYGAEHVAVLRGVYQNLLVAFSRNPALRLNVPPLYDTDEVKHAIKLGHGPAYNYQWPATIPERIDEIVERYPTHVALIDGDGRKMSYTEMARRVNTLAVVLLRQDIGQGSKVGVFMEPGSSWICSLLAILRLDAIYIPLDSRMGLDRLSTIVRDCKPDLLLVDNTTLSNVALLGLSCPTLNVDVVSPGSDQQHVPNTAQPSSTAVIMYTSGSTGVPKGIVMQHHTFRNNIETSTEKWDFREGRETTLQQSSYSFDMSLSQTFLTLSNGGTLRIVPKKLRGDPKAIASLITAEGITFTETTPSEYISWLRYGDVDDLRKSKWRIAVSGGETITTNLTGLLRQLEKSDLRLIDCYGPTEITFCSHGREVQYDGEGDILSPAFRTWPNYSVYIVDSHMKPVPIGIPGEILIGGAGVVAGYVHSELDARGFARNNFMNTMFLENAWTRLHRTGDFGRLDQEGNLILGGRIAGDTQVKLRGIRIDLQEIESAILSSGDGKIVDAAVTVRESADSGSEYLMAFVTTLDAGDLSLERIRQELPLPQHMRPANIITLDQLPMTASNKVDRLALKSLPLPPGSHVADTGTDESPSMAKMRDVWATVIPQEVLAHFELGPASNFFQVGGDSMLLVRLQTEINKVFGTSISLFQLFDASSLTGMVSLIDHSESTSQRSEVDWETETTISPSLLQVPATKRFFAHPAVVVLTGATGFLGRAIVNRLLKDCSVQKIHCVAVRRDPSSLPDDFKSPKVVLHRGDLTLPQLGLTDRAATEIFAEADAVIHNGADVSFMKTYQSLKQANLEATKELVRLSAPHRLSFHYISSASVTRLAGQESFDQSSVSAFPPSAEDGYVASKWASERYLEKVSDQCGLPIWIHRPSSIVGEGAPDTDMMASLLGYSRTLRAIPQTDGWTGWLDFVSADRVAMQIADEVYEDYSWPGTVKYLYEAGDREIPLSDLRGVLERETGESFESIPLEEWVLRAEGQGLHPLLGEYLRRVSGIPLVLPRLVQQGSFF
ncbi:putative hybrid NRPS/PKS enzyme [Aspergillus clavatus NRRL 1]|uniref:Polyketide synthase-nonribosomal peptide synthetase n=1 Tax=Aspergillus clavatus (strain ATCC 1007 / CBS 513.65 / DSM 816 / NCTC 3887 / NRRL 1 / QM 1276 / 107) TaxID=344612 RepID=CCSA_ASPCL|nr:hybrid NRPS/PKS enzyme, putative [Aspergillus clavatus NRRL 1]A1CLY8.1 RecName: Full=Polyketide synthase-nonribosomal peptide synthetase; Short=PKS-NRPS; AltName: Full=Cytochalasin biosynthesis protein A [Aspergillus clavatus NRRL 1]EAW09117.1 hybrid NRPS/PKS enzyme, putative [Aspergillus clavatus NRRL 1]